MKALVDRLSAELSAKYIQYIETFMVDLWSGAGFIEFHCGFCLRRDHKLQRFTLKVPALAGETDADRELLIVVIFDEIEELVYKAIAADRMSGN